MNSVVMQIAKSSNALGFDLWSQLRSTPGNLTLSPFSVSSALAMTYGGARANTAVEMAKVLNIDLSPEQALIDFGRFSATIQESKDITIRVANRLFPEMRYKFHQNYLDLVEKSKGALPQPLDYRNNPDFSRIQINEWVSEHTNNLINDLLPVGSIDDTTRLVLTNAVYFLASWLHKFDKNWTHKAPFTMVSGDNVPAMLMHREAKHEHGQTDNLQLLVLPYANRTTSMLIVLPDNIDSLDEVERALSVDVLQKWRKSVSKKTVDVFLPRFKLDPTAAVRLSNPLKELGMNEPFGDNADFTGMAPAHQEDEALRISEIYHKTFVKTDEDGTEAAAATAVAMSRTMSSMAPELPAVFRADHPFLFFIQDDTTGAVLFMGRVADPSK